MFSAHSRKTLAEVIFKLVNIVEELIYKEMKNTKGRLLCDSWCSNGTHFIGVFASYSIEISLMVNFSSTQKSNVHRTLISVAQMARFHDSHNDDSYEDGSHETTYFNAETHRNFFNYTFEIYGAGFCKWCVALLFDNTAMN